MHEGEIVVYNYSEKLAKDILKVLPDTPSVVIFINFSFPQRVYPAGQRIVYILTIELMVERMQDRRTRARTPLFENDKIAILQKLPSRNGPLMRFLGYS